MLRRTFFKALAGAALALSGLMPDLAPPRPETVPLGDGDWYVIYYCFGNDGKPVAPYYYVFDGSGMELRSGYGARGFVHFTPHPHSIIT